MAKFLIAAVIVACVATPNLVFRDTRAAEAVLGPEAAKTIPIADAHFHVMPWMNLAELIGYMDRNGVRWTGGAGVQGTPAKNQEAASVLGKRYIKFTGQSQWITLKQERGVAGLEDADSPAFKQRLKLMEADLRDGGARGMGEIHVNARTSAANERLLHKIRADAPTLKAMLDLAARYIRVLSLHAQWDPDTAEQFGRLAESNQKARLFLAHCGNFAGAEEIRALFAKHANVSCDISYRSPPQLKQRNRDRAIFDRDGGFRGDWKKLIEDYPERFIVGIDDVHSWQEYEEVAQNIRFGLLANLSPAAAEKVAYKNAQLIFGLD